MRIRASDQYETLQEYRVRQAEAYVARNAARMRRDFWARKEQDRIEGEWRLANQEIES